MSVTEQIVDQQADNNNSHVTIIKAADASICVRLMQISHALPSTPTLFNLDELQASYSRFSPASTEHDHFKSSLGTLCHNSVQPMTSSLAFGTGHQHKTTIDYSGSRDGDRYTSANVMS